MAQRIYKTTEGEQDFYFAVAEEKDGIVVSIFHEDPSGGEVEADAVAQLRVETESKVIRVLAHLWDDETDKEGVSTHLITLIEGEKQDVC